MSGSSDHASAAFATRGTLVRAQRPAASGRRRHSRRRTGRRHPCRVRMRPADVRGGVAEADYVPYLRDTSGAHGRQGRRVFWTVGTPGADTSLDGTARDRPSRSPPRMSATRPAPLMRRLLGRGPSVCWRAIGPAALLHPWKATVTLPLSRSMPSGRRWALPIVRSASCAAWLMPAPRTCLIWCGPSRAVLTLSRPGGANAPAPPRGRSPTGGTASRTLARGGRR